MRKKSVLLAIIIILVAITVLINKPVHAANGLGGERLLKDVNRMQTQASRAATVQQNELQNIIKRSDTLIGNRLNTLNQLSTRVQADSRLSSSEKSSLSTDIQTDISGLTSLKAKIDADTDVTTARADEKEIITSYYVYAIFEPKMRLLIILNNLQEVTTNLQAIVPQLQSLINTLQSQGKNISQLQSLLNDISSQLTTASTTISADITAVQGVSTTSGVSSAEQTFAKTRQDIAQIVRTGFAKVRSDFAQMRPLFRSLIVVTPSGSPTTTSTPSSSSATSQ